ncbi:hypothetical protein H2198_010378 [Neophaeococcomyces mojaviensis]|uniref:Uncharacterized protein n=1 Tax=Neophaeococcomyces mojaviensis TaxID=3383035 RepID=A0ACC2ZRQ9_9EURO|nr:hypothetical protein H2198_010378 [Knufia sp. JES_112]
MATQEVQSRGIYHGLPVYDSSVKGLTAIITGANGISGHYMLRVLSQSPERWTKIYCLSRRPPYIAGGLPDNAEHITCDFLKSPDEIGEVLKGNLKGGENVHVFFFAYLQPPPKEGKGLWSDAHEMVRVNSLLLDNFIGGLKAAGIQPRKFMLQTGAKNYGGHHGPTKVPQEETDPRVEILDEPNFYYPQEDSVWKYCTESNGQSTWNICMPGPILGAVPDAAMNAAFPLAVYATVCKELGEPLRWPGDAKAWQMECSMSSAMMNAYMEEWAVLSSRATNQKFNTCDSSTFAWEGFWPRLAGWYGIDWLGPQDDAQYTMRETPHNPRGYGGKGVSGRTFTMIDWAKQSKVQEAWKKIAQQHELSVKELADVERIFGFLDGSLCRSSPLMFSMDKARKMGWHGFTDTNESLLDVFDDFAKIKMIPPVPKVKVQFN